ncbi:MAG TPA: CBS domain-containing protein [Thermoanaerobaculia bacterium]|nr:CBS domain-containing protein [Thermoanaerobaculia bacterium]
MELITTHLGADFDAFASVVAARRLHPEARVLFPGSREEAVRRMLAETELVVLDELRQRNVDPGELERVILCDTRQARRLGVVAEWLAGRPEVPVLAYDHHPDSDDDLPLAGGLVDPAVGAASTLMAELLRERGLELPANEATVLLMGIYEDTGSLTFPTTSARDYAAAAWLLERGGDLAAVRRFALYRLDPVHLEVLHRMTRELEVVRVHGHRVGLVALELGEFVGELAPLVSRCLELFELPLLFGLFGDGEHVAVIARGQVPASPGGQGPRAVGGEGPTVHLGEILQRLGGGGHETAAAARLHDTTVLEVRERLLALLADELPPAARAADLALADFFVLPSGTAVAAAKKALVERRINSAPVAAPDGRLVGAVSRQTLDAALQHGLGERPVERVMDRNLEWVRPDEPAEEVGRRMTERHPRFVLVGERQAGRAEGLVTRMQVLRHLHSRLAAQQVQLDRAEHLRVHHESAARLLAELAPAVARRVETAARLSRQADVPVYLVGGLVRDLLLGRDNRDVDLVVEGDGPWFARRLAEALGGRAREHAAFLTAVVVDAEDFHVDVATARSEFYREPAALPQVQSGELRQDLYRRDFTINTLAVRLGPGRTPELIDHFGGRRDLEDGVIRVLHSLSFIDDPTRVLRAVRLEQRLGFEIAPETLHLLEVALEEGVFERLSGSRLREEMILLLDDAAVALRGLDRLDELGVLAVLDPELTLDDAARERLRAAVGAHHWFRVEELEPAFPGWPEVRLWRLLLLALADGLAPQVRERLAARLRLAGAELAVLARSPERRAAALAVLGRPAARPHEIADALAPLPGEDLLLLLALGDEEVRRRVRQDLTEHRRLELTVRGADLLAAGIPPGPAVGEALRRTRHARLDGEIGPAEERAHAVRRAREALAAADGGGDTEGGDTGGDTDGGDPGAGEATEAGVEPGAAVEVER